MSALLTRTEGVIALTPAADYSAKRGALVKVTATTATLSASATVPSHGVILEGNKTTAGYATEKVTVGLLGCFCGTALGKLGGTVAAGDLVQQNSDETIVTDAGTGARTIVGVALEAGVSGDLIEIAFYAPQIRS